MGRRPTKAETTLITWALIIGLPIYIISKLVDSIGWGPLIGYSVLFVGILVLCDVVKWKLRKDYLMEKYKDACLVAKLMKKDFWVGQTAGQLLDSLGNPQDVDEKFLVTKKKEVWKYHHKGGNRYGLRITLDDDIVVGYDYKW